MDGLGEGKHGLRPFVCDGSPFACDIFIVGTNPKRQIGKPFWEFWSDTEGMDKARFMACYQKAHLLSKTRVQMYGLMSELASTKVLETNVFAAATDGEEDLRKKDQRTDCFAFLLTTIKPKVVFVHGRKAIKTLGRLTGEALRKERLEKRAYGNTRFFAYAAVRHLSRVSLETAKGYGREMGRCLQSSPR